MPADPQHHRGHDHEEENLLSPSQRTELDDDRESGGQPHPSRRPGGTEQPSPRDATTEAVETRESTGLDKVDADSFPSSDPPSH